MAEDRERSFWDVMLEEVNAGKSLERTVAELASDDVFPTEYIAGIPEEFERRRRMPIRMYGRCTNPVTLNTNYKELELLAPCRVCQACLRARRLQWALRCEAEFMASDITYLFTGTFAEQTSDQQLVKDTVTMFLDRLRKRARIRYFVTNEHHKSGKLHVHALIHGGGDLLGKTIWECWRAGWAWVDECDFNGASYVAKYVGKELDRDVGAKKNRIRCSRNPMYGGSVVIRDPLILREIASKDKVVISEIYEKNIVEVIRRENAKETEHWFDRIQREAGIG